MINVFKNARSGAIYISMVVPEKADEDTFCNTFVENNLREVYVDKPVGVRDAFDVWRTEVRDAATPLMIEVNVEKDIAEWVITFAGKYETYRKTDSGWETSIFKTEDDALEHKGSIGGFKCSYEDCINPFPVIRTAM